MKLIFLGEEIDSSVEQELFFNEKKHPFGFDVKVEQIDGEIFVRNNCTEVHHKFKAGRFPDNPGIAFESDIHRTGGTRNVNELKSVTITIASDIADDHRSQR